MNSPSRMHAPVRRQQGLTLVELMVSMVLGLVVIGGAVSLMLANRQSYSTNEGISQIQESARTAFELLARDVREAGISGCDNRGRIANVLDPLGGQWWQTWFGIRGFTGAQNSTGVAFGAARGQRVAGTDSIQLQGIQGLGMSIANHDPATSTIQINAAAADIGVGDIMMACDFDHATIFRVTGYNAASVSLTHVQGGVAPGNCSSGLGFPTVCTTVGTAHQFERNSLLADFVAAEWYIGNSERAADTGRSLFRRRLGNAGAVVAEEIVSDVTDMEITYRVGDEDDFNPANTLAVADWDDVNAVRILLTISNADARVSTDAAVNNGRLEREFTQVVALRNRIP